MPERSRSTSTDLVDAPADRTEDPAEPDTAPAPATSAETEQAAEQATEDEQVTVRLPPEPATQPAEAAVTPAAEDKVAQVPATEDDAGDDDVAEGETASAEAVAAPADPTGQATTEPVDTAEPELPVKAPDTDQAKPGTKADTEPAKKTAGQEPDSHPPKKLTPTDPGLAEEPSDAEPAPALIDGPTQLLSLATIRQHLGDSARAGGPDSVVASAPVVGEPDAKARALGQLGWLASGLLMAMVGLLRIDRPGLWGDELATWGMTTVSWDEMVPLLRNFDVVLGPYYALMRGWTELVGDSDTALRLPSLLAMVASAAMIAAIGSRLASPRVGLLAGLIFALLPPTSRYAQEARPYALTTFAAVLATLLLLRAFDRPKFWRWLGYTIAVALVAALHPVALALVAAHGFIVLVKRPRLFLRWFPAALVGCAPAGPLLWLGNEQKEQISWIAEGDLDTLVNFPTLFFGTAVLAGIVLALALFAISLQQPGLVYTAWALIPAAVIFAVSTQTPLWSPRYLLFTIPAWALLAATALSRAPLMRGMVAVLAIGVLAIPVHVEMREAGGHTQDTRRFTGLIAALAQPGDGIVYGPLNGEARLGRDAVAHYLPESQRPKDLLMVRPQRTEGQVFAEECGDVEACVGSTERIWVMRIGTYRDALFQIGTVKEQPLREYDVARTWHPEGLTVALLTRKPA